MKGGNEVSEANGITLRRAGVRKPSENNSVSVTTLPLVAPLPPFIKSLVLILYTYFELKQYEPARKKLSRGKNVQFCVDYMESHHQIFGFSALWTDNFDSFDGIDGVGDSN